MRKITILFIIIIVIIIGTILLINANNDSNENTTDNNPEVALDENRGDVVPDFSYERFDGTGEMTQDDLTADISVINIWATWCPFCVDELSDFGKLKETFPDEVEIIAINRQESRDKVQNYFNNEGIFLTETITFLQDSQDSFARNIGRISMPETIFVTPDGEILFHKRGPMELDEMIDIINELLG